MGNSRISTSHVPKSVEVNPDSRDAVPAVLSASCLLPAERTTGCLFIPDRRSISFFRTPTKFLITHRVEDLLPGLRQAAGDDVLPHLDIHLVTDLPPYDSDARVDLLRRSPLALGAVLPFDRVHTIGIADTCEYLGWDWERLGPPGDDGLRQLVASHLESGPWSDDTSKAWLAALAWSAAGILLGRCPPTEPQSPEGMIGGEQRVRLAASKGDDRDQLVPRDQLRQMIPVSDMTIWRWIRAGIFPQPIRIRSRCYWRLSDLQAWLASEDAKRNK